MGHSMGGCHRTDPAFIGKPVDRLLLAIIDHFKWNGATGGALFEGDCSTCWVALLLVSFWFHFTAQIFTDGLRAHLAFSAWLAYVFLLLED